MMHLLYNLSCASCDGHMQSLFARSAVTVLRGTIVTQFYGYSMLIYTLIALAIICATYLYLVWIAGIMIARAMRR
jgi:hypothetical protein